MYTVLCQYAKRLHYERLLQFEYLYRASKIYNKNNKEKIPPKKLLQLTHKAFDFITQQIQEKPNEFTQKLNARELRKARIKNALKLQARNKKIRQQNIAIIQLAIKSGKHFMSDGRTLNVTSLSTATNISRVTITKILKSL